MICYLSYPMADSIPVYGGQANLNLRQVKNIAQGDTCNVWRFCLENHWGTHVDCPSHFFEEGKKITDYPPDFWLFRNPQVIKVEAEPGRIFSREDITCDLQSETDMILFQSGWGKIRGSEEYKTRNPGLHPDLGRWLRKNYSGVRAVGMDWISISSFENRDMGREAHKAFLDPQVNGQPILVIEDMNLKADLTDLKEVWVAPLIVEGIDSAPCTVIGFLG